MPAGHPAALQEELMKTVIAVAAVILSSAGAVCAQTLDDLRTTAKISTIS